MLKEFVKYYKPHRKLFFLDMGTAAGLAIVGIIIPALSYKVFNLYLPEKKLEMIYISLGAWGVLIFFLNP